MIIQDKVAIVTGGGSGIGVGICGRLAEAGGKIAIFDMDIQGAQKTAQDIDKAGGKALALKVDVTRATDIESAVKQVISAFGRVDILVNDAGITSHSLVTETTEEAWDKTHDVNLKGVFLCCRAVAPSMKEQKYGKILNIASISAFKAKPRFAHYASSKAGVVAFTINLAAELGPFNINVNAIAPGFIETPLSKRDTSLQERQAVTKMVPMRRLGAPRDIGNAVLFLVSDEASYITGQCLAVCGGLNHS